MDDSSEYITVDEKPSQWAWWRWDYLVDWAVLGVVCMTELLLSHLVFSPYERYLPANDPAVSYPNLPDTIPSWSLAFIDGLLPILIFVAWQYLMRSSHDLHHATLGLAQALVFTLLFTDAVKISAGRYRPDWQARVDGKLSESVLRDGRQSFPSGHSSIAFAGMVYLSLWLSGKLGLFRHHGGTSWKACVILCPIAVATLVAVSRTRDYHHDFSDILAGAVLGAGMAVFAYYLNYHSLSSDKSHLPKLRVDQRVAYYHYHQSSSSLGSSPV